MVKTEPPPHDPYYNKEHPSYSLAPTGYLTETCVIKLIIDIFCFGFPLFILGSFIKKLALVQIGRLEMRLIETGKILS